jgi:hypothetical protein
VSGIIPPGAPVTTFNQFTPQAKMEMLSWLQPWFPKKTGGGGTASLERDLLVVIDGLGSPPAVAISGDTPLDFDCEIVGWTILADQVGSVELDIWKDVYANYPPDVSDSIVASAPPKIVADDSNTNTGLVGWTKQVQAGDCLRFSVVSVATITRLTLALHLNG